MGEKWEGDCFSLSLGCTRRLLFGFEFGSSYLFVSVVM
jgi:hypothetical protein